MSYRPPVALALLVLACQSPILGAQAAPAKPPAAQAPAKPATSPAPGKPVGEVSSQTPAPKPPSPRPAARPAPSVTNADIIKMVKAGLSDSIIRLGIRQSTRRTFNLSPDGLLELKAAGVSDDLIRFMADPTAPEPADPPPPRETAEAKPALPPPPPPVVPDERLASGIYLDEESGKTLLEPIAFAVIDTGNVMRSVWSMGRAKGKQKIVVQTPRASRRVTNTAPAFVFHLEKSALQEMSSPNEFVFARMDVKGMERELIVAQTAGTGVGGASRIQADRVVEMRVENVRAGVYRVTPAMPLAPGEYAFFYPGGSGKLFDFGVDQ